MELEADRVADLVMRQPEQEGGRQQEEEEPYREPAEPIGLGSGDLLQMAAGGSPSHRENGAIAPEVEASIRGVGEGGQLLPSRARGFFEGRFGYDFARVRVHAGTDAARLSAALGARAFTGGSSIFFGAGQYDPDGRAGRHLLAHELTHVVQQGGAGAGPEVVRRTLAGGFTNYRGSCECGEDLGNNCAHFLSDALIRAGHDELDGGVGGLYRRHGGRVVCRSGRPVRAREMRDWFSAQASTNQNGEPTDDSRYWAVYQERASDGQGHVVIHHHTGTGTEYDFRGTGDYPSWRTQRHYTW
jgi:hypothetical protein